MSVAVESDLSSIKETIKNLKLKRGSLQQQLVSAVKEHGEVTDANREGSIKGFLGKFYRPVSVPQPRLCRQEISTEIEAIDESLERLRPIYQSAKERSDRETEAMMMPEYVAALEKLIANVELAIQSNETVLALERKFPKPLSLSRSWDVLGPLGWGFGESLRDWRQRANSFLKSKQGES